ncbi:MAG TPA: DUF4349 domain-containing protein [Blastocatellia bacterium]|nr:DUF4349 domain-containing protein [Blastocatellia bacterium]
MRFLTGFLLALTVTSLGCNTNQRKGRQAGPSKAETHVETSTADAERPLPAGGGNASKGALPALEFAGGGGVGGGGGTLRRPMADDISAVSLTSIGTVYAATEAVERKIIRNGELTLETESPTDGLRKITAAAEAHGGFVVTSEFKQNNVAAGAKPSQSVTVVARVPASQFASAMEQIRTAGERVVSEKVTGQDVSEEYLDLEARLRNKKALEGQFLEIMKQARKVEDALEVQSQLADVRTEIERLEGRRRFLENQAALSTITTTLQMPQPIIAATPSGFGATIKRAFGDAVDTAVSIGLFVIQAVIVLVPITFFFGLPGWVVWRALRRRVVLFRKPEPSPIPNE